MLKKKKSATRRFKVGEIIGNLKILESPDTETCQQIFNDRKYRVQCCNCGTERVVSRTTMNQRLLADRKGQESRYCVKCKPREGKNGFKPRKQAFKPFHVPGWGLITHLGPMGHRHQTSNHHESTMKAP